MNSILPSKQSVCPSCGAYNPPGSSVCEVCGTKRDVPPKEHGLFSDKIHFLIGLFIIVIGAFGLFRYYPPGKIIVIYSRQGQDSFSRATTESDVLFWGVIPLGIGFLYLLFAVASKVKEKFFR